MEFSDKTIVEGLLNRNESITKEFLYRKCYPLFKSVYDNYHTDCSSCLEFINEIYIYLMIPDKITGQCKLEGFQFRSTLFTWLKTIAVFYCYKRYKRVENSEIIRIHDNSETGGVRIDHLSDSIENETSLFSIQDVEKILQLMPNRRYSMLIRLKYLEEKSNEETAKILGMNMNTFYNKHKLAKDQYIKVLRKEECYGR